MVEVALMAEKSLQVERLESEASVVLQASLPPPFALVSLGSQVGSALTFR